MFSSWFLHLGVALAAVAGRAGIGAVRAGARRLVAARADHLKVGQLDRRLALEDAALDVPLRVRTRVLLIEAHALDDRLSLHGIDAEHHALLATVFAGEHDDDVALLH